MNRELHPPPTDFGALLTLAARQAVRKQPRAALVVPSSQTWLTAFDQVIRQGLVDPTIIGDEQLLDRHRSEFGLELQGAKVIDINQPRMAWITAAQMAARGELDLIVKGRGSTIEFLHCILDKDAHFVDHGRCLSHIGVFKPELYSKLLMITDGGVVPQPDLQTKVALISNLIGLAAALGINMPRIAVIAAVEAIYPQMAATTDAAVLAKMCDRGQIKGAYVDGPLSFDVAIDPVAAQAKGIVDSEVAGRADAMVASNIETANGVIRAMALYGRAEVGGLLFGGRVPVALGNRWDTPSMRLSSLVLGILAAQRQMP
ncbi:MAG: phosphate acyltransferase [bacterium]